MSIKKKVSIRNAVFDALDNMGMQDHKMVPVLTRWATLADIKIKSAYAYEPKIHVLTAKGCSMELPCQVVIFGGMIYGDHGCDCGALFDSVYGQLGITKVNPDGSGNFLVVDTASGTRLTKLGGQIIDNTIWFNRDVDGQVFTIRTQDYFVDDDGFVMVNENHVDAISTYLEFRLAKRSRWNKKLGNISESGIRDLKNDWHLACADARADDVDDSEHEIVAAMFNNPISGGYSVYGEIFQ